MNPYRFVTVEGDARTWHTPIVAVAVRDAIGAGILADDIGTMLKGKGYRLQLDMQTAVHAGAPREERTSSLWISSRHRYHDGPERIADQSLRTRRQIERWAFNERRAKALGAGSCDLPENRWAIHVPLVARRYMEWRGLDHAGLLFCLDDEETFKADNSGDRITSFSCVLGEARIDVNWRRTDVDVPIAIPHTLDASIIGQPVGRVIQQPVLDDPLLVIADIRRNLGRTVLVLERAWTTLGDAP